MAVHLGEKIDACDLVMGSFGKYRMPANDTKVGWPIVNVVRIVVVETILLRHGPAFPYKVVHYTSQPGAANAETGLGHNSDNRASQFEARQGPHSL